MEPQSTEKLSRADLARFVEVEGLCSRLGWKDKSWSGEEVLTALGIRGLAPPHCSARKITPGSGRSVVYYREARDWLLELALRVEQHGWAWSREPILLRRRALLSGSRLAARADRPLVDIILDRAVCDLLNLQANTVEGLASASERLVLCKGALSNGEDPLVRMLESNRRWSARTRGPTPEALKWGPALVLCPRTRDSARSFLGDDLEEFTRMQRAWRETLESILRHGNGAARALEDRHGLGEREHHLVDSPEFSFPILPGTWDEFLRWRLSWLVHRRPQRTEASTLLDLEVPPGPLDEVIGMTEDGSFGMWSRAESRVVRLMTAVA